MTSLPKIEFFFFRRGDDAIVTKPDLEGKPCFWGGSIFALIFNTPYTSHTGAGGRDRPNEPRSLLARVFGINSLCLSPSL